VSDREEIIQTINLYGLALDTQRWDLFDMVFTSHVHVDYGGKVSWDDLEKFRKDFSGFMAPFDSTQHAMANHVVRVLGDVAHSMTYSNWRLLRHSTYGDPLWEGTSWYDDEWARTHAGWRIRKRVSRMMWSTGNPAVGEVIPGVSYNHAHDSLRDHARDKRMMLLNAIDARA